MAQYPCDAIDNNAWSASKSGKSKLMLKLPSIRTAINARPGSPVDDLAEAYDLATNMCERLRREKIENILLLAEYEAICRDIENEILHYINKLVCR